MEKPQPQGVWRIPVGLALIFAGLIGCVLPIAPGIPLILAGLALLSRHYRWARRAITRIKSAWRSLRRRYAQ